MQRAFIRCGVRNNVTGSQCRQGVAELSQGGVVGVEHIQDLQHAGAAHMLMSRFVSRSSTTKSK